MVIFASLRVTPCVDLPFWFTAWFNSASVNTSDTGLDLLSRAKVLIESPRPSTAPDAKTSPGAVAAQTLVTTVDGSKADSPSGGPGVTVMPPRNIWPAASGPSMIRLALDVVPTKTSTTNAETPMAFGDVRKTPQRPGVASRMVILSVLSTQPKISAFPPAVPQD